MDLANFDKVQKDDNHLYYNIDLVNNETVDNNKDDPQVKYSDYSNVPLLEDASDYYFSIIRFQLNGIGKNIPVFIPKIVADQSDINKTIYQVGLMYNYRYANIIQKQEVKVLNISFETQNKMTPPPKTPNDYSNNYYFVYTYSHFIKLVNDTIKLINDELFERVKTSHPNTSLNIITDSFKPEPPTIYYENQSQMFKLYLDKMAYGRKTDSFKWDTLDVDKHLVDIKARLFFNSNLYNLFANFHHHYLGGDLKNNIEYLDLANQTKSLSVEGCAFEILPIKNDLGLDSYTFNNKDYYVLKQDFESISSFWCPISSIVFTTNLLPIMPELSGQPIEFKDGKEHKSTTVQNYEKVITDLILPLGAPDSYNRAITYYPSSEYRLSEFTKSKFSLRNIGLSGFYKLRTNGRLIPLTLPNQSSISIKIMFRRRSF